MRRPNFFLIGAPKAGTTALFSYLSAHPNFFASEPKELLFWSTDFMRSNDSAYITIETEQDYLSLFSSAQDHHLVLGEATVSYLYSSVAVKKILEFNQSAKLVVMLRNPIELVYGWHTELLYNGYETERQFEKAWMLQGSRSRGLHLPRGCFVPEFLQYESVGRLGEQVRRLLTLAPRDQVHFESYDDFSTNPRSVYVRTLDFLGLDDDGRMAFERVNRSKGLRARWLGELFFSPPPKYREVAKFFRRHASQLGITKVLLPLFQTSRIRQPLSTEFANHLKNVYREDVSLLSSLLGRDFSHWVR